MKILVRTIVISMYVAGAATQWTACGRLPDLCDTKDREGLRLMFSTLWPLFVITAAVYRSGDYLEDRLHKIAEERREEERAKQ